MTFQVLSAGPSVTVQDFGRSGLMAVGVSVGGASDVLAMHESGALLGQSPDHAVLEMAGFGGSFQATQPLRLSLTGASAPVTLDGEALAWNTSHAWPEGAILNIGANTGGYSYLGVGGGLDTAEILGARSAHLKAGIGTRVAEGDVIPTGTDSGGPVGLTFTSTLRRPGAPLRITPSLHSDLFTDDQHAALGTLPFTRAMRSDRSALRLDGAGDVLCAQGALNVLSDMTIPGDIQITGDGTPFILLGEGQTTAGYPRIANVLPCDLPDAVQTAIGGAIAFEVVSLEDGLAALAAWRRELKALPSRVAPAVRDPADVKDLLSMQLISGVVSATDS